MILPICKQRYQLLVCDAVNHRPTCETELTLFKRMIVSQSVEYMTLKIMDKAVISTMKLLLGISSMADASAMITNTGHHVV
jgi:hypothetical protein